MIRICITFFCLIFLITSCGGPKYQLATEGSQEFVLDSYKIRQGKFSILELSGVSYPPLHPQYLDEYQDTIDDDDILKVAFFHPVRKDLVEVYNQVGESIGFRVTNGALRLPGLDPLNVKGMTLEQARLAVLNSYEGQISNVEIFIEYGRRLHSKVELMGAVGLPEVPVNGRIRLFEVLSLAKIPNNATGDKKSIQIIRGNILCPKIYTLSWNHITYLPNDSLLLMPGDTIYISEKPITKWNRFIEQLLPSGLLIDLGIKTSGVLH
jgi:polysaccharide export outer membrane protein